jgi:hypothetical protein
MNIQQGTSCLNHLKSTTLHASSKFLRFAVLLVIIVREETKTNRIPTSKFNNNSKNYDNSKNPNNKNNNSSEQHGWRDIGNIVQNTIIERTVIHTLLIRSVRIRLQIND